MIQKIPEFQGTCKDKAESKPNSAESQGDDVRFPLLSIMRQRTLPVQIDTSIMRILPKVSFLTIPCTCFLIIIFLFQHVVKRIKSANSPNNGTPKPKFKK